MKSWLIIDGYNLIHRQGAPRNLTGDRQALIRRIESLAGVLAERITLVFDGRTRDRPEVPESSVIEVIFSPSDKTADTVIEQMVCQAEHPTDIMVVTSDFGEADTVRAGGAEVMSCGQFLDFLLEQEEALDRQLRNFRTKAPPISIGDLFSHWDSPRQS